MQHYDKTKRAADQFNHLVSNFHNNHPQCTTKLTLLNGILEWAITNGYIMYKYHNTHPVSHHQYWEKISEHLLINK